MPKLINLVRKKQPILSTKPQLEVDKLALEIEALKYKRSLFGKGAGW